MGEIEYAFWEIQYKSCEGNDRWTVARTPIDWEEYDVRDRTLYAKFKPYLPTLYIVNYFQYRCANMRSKFFLKKLDKSKFISYICCYKQLKSYKSGPKNTNQHLDIFI